jgi:hypothetical protein
VSVLPYPYGNAQQSNQCIARTYAACLWAWMSRRTGLINFSSRDACKAHPWPFLTPDGTITIPNMGWRALEHLAAFDDWNL